MIIGLLIETEQIMPAAIVMEQTIFLGEVGLNCELNHFHGVLPMVIEAKNKGFKNVVLPHYSLHETSRVKGIELFGFAYLPEVIRWMEKRLKYKASDLYRSRQRVESIGDKPWVPGNKSEISIIAVFK